MIPISEKENSYEKYWEEKHRSKKKKAILRNDIDYHIVTSEATFSNILSFSIKPEQSWT